MTAVRNSLLRALRERVNELPGLIDGLDLETLPDRHQEQIDRLRAENERLTAWLCICPFATPERVETNEECPIHGDGSYPQLTMRAALTWRTAFESLHARILRDLPGDGSELPQPEDGFWAAQLDGLVSYASKLAHETEGGN